MQLKEQYDHESAPAQIRREVDAGAIRTWSGILLDPLRPTGNTVRIDDIAHALARICRYGGHVPSFYSVGQHCLEVQSYLADRGATPLLQLLGLLHDAEEAYFGDMPSPLKKSFHDFRKYGDAMREFVWDKYVPGWRDLPRHYEEMVHEADQHMYQIERMSFWMPRSQAKRLCVQKYNRSVLEYATSCTEVEAEYLRRFAALGKADRVSVEGRGTVSPKSDHERY